MNTFRVGFVSGKTGDPPLQMENLWVKYQENRPPKKPYYCAPNGYIYSWIPVFVARFDDPDVGFGDQMTGYEIEVANGTDLGEPFFSAAFEASPLERKYGMVCRPYAGSVDLVPGQRYRWHVRVKDEFNIWSEWSEWSDLTLIEIAK